MHQLRLTVLILSFVIPAGNGAAQMSWQKTSGPSGATPVAMSFGSRDTIFMTTEGGGVYTSSNSGNSWISINAGLSDERMSSIVVTRDGNLFVGSAAGIRIWKSTNRGQTWNYSSAGLPDTLGESFARFLEVLPSGDILLGVDDFWAWGSPLTSVYRSTDNGVHWIASASGLPPRTSGSIMSLDASSSGLVAAGTMSGLYLSSDEGRTWEACLEVPYPTSGISINNDRDIYVAWGRLQHSTDRGSTWKTIEGLNNPDVWGVSVDRTGSIIVKTSAGIEYSTNQGVNWTRSQLSYRGMGYDINIDSSNRMYVGLPNTGLVSSSNLGTTWMMSDSGLAHANISALFSGSDGILLAGGYDGGMHRSTDQGATWSRVLMHDSTRLAVTDIVTQTSGKLVASIGNKESGQVGGGIIVSTDRGISWLSSSAGLPVCTIFDLTVLPSGLVLASTSKGIFRSEDNAMSWQPSSAGLGTPYVNQIIFRSANGWELYAATQYKGVYRSVDTGRTWTESNGGIADIGIQTIVVTQSGKFFAAEPENSGQGYRISVNGNQWSAKRSLLREQIIERFAINSIDHIFAVSNNGIFRSTDQGATWEHLTEGLSHPSCWTIAFNDSGQAFVATKFGGVYRSSRSMVIVPSEIPVLIEPSQSSIDVPISATFRWKSAMRAETYRVQVSKSATFTSMVFDSSGLSDTTFVLNGLAHSATYYWRVNASNSFGPTPWSSVRTFTVIDPAPAIVALESPAESEKNLPMTIQCIWRTVTFARSYTFEIALDSTFLVPIVQRSGLTDTSSTFSGLTPATWYFWRVNAINSSGAGPWSVIRRFQTIALPAPPLLNAPPDQWTLFDTDTTLSWDPVPYAASYSLQIARTQSFAAPDTVYKGLTFSSLMVRFKQAYAQYYWRVSATNNAGTSAWSTPWSLTTGFEDTTQAVGIDALPNPESPGFSLDQNYPNPFTDRTTIRFRISADGSHGALPVRVSIQDLLGRTVAVLVDEPFAAGEYRIPFSMQPVSGRWTSGMYLCRMETPGGIVSRMMTIVR